MRETINWEKIWEDTIRDTASRSSVQYWESRAEDYSDMVLHSRFDHGEKIRSFCFTEGMADSDSDVLDIGSGPGALTIPFARHVRRVTAVEPAIQMIKRLSENAKKEQIDNILPINKTWQEIDISEYARAFDLVLCCHSLWHFPDILLQVNRMNQVSRGFCGIAGGFGSNKETADLYAKLGVNEIEFDQFHTLFNLLNDRGYAPNVQVLPYSLRRSEQSAVSSMEQVVMKYHPLTDENRKIIREYVRGQTDEGVFSGSGLMGLLWWKVA